MLSSALLTLVLCTGQVLLEPLGPQSSSQSPAPFRLSQWNTGRTTPSASTAQPPQKSSSFDRSADGSALPTRLGLLPRQNSLGSAPAKPKPWQGTPSFNSRAGVAGSPSGASTPGSAGPLPRSTFLGLPPAAGSAPSTPQRLLGKPPSRSDSFGDSATGALSQPLAPKFGANRSVSQNNDPASPSTSALSSPGVGRYGSRNYGVSGGIGLPRISSGGFGVPRSSSSSGFSTPNLAKPASSIIESLGKKIEQSPLQEIRTPLKSLTEIYSKMTNDDSKTITATVDGQSTQIDIGERGSSDRQTYMQAAKKYLENARQDADSIISPASKSPVAKQLSKSPSQSESEIDPEKVHPNKKCTPAVVQGNKMRLINEDGTLGPEQPLSPALQKRYDEEQARLANESSDPEHDIDGGNACIMHKGTMVCPGHPDYEKVKAEHEHNLDSGYSSGDACIKYKNRIVCPGDPEYEKAKAAAAGEHDHNFDIDVEEGDACIRYKGKTVCPGHPDYKKAKEEQEEKSRDDALDQLRSMLSSTSIGQLGPAKPFGGIDTEDLGVDDYGEYSY